MVGNVGISAKVKVPKGNLNVAIFEEEIFKIINRESKPAVKQLYESTVEGWKNKPTFNVTVVRNRGRRISLKVQPTGRNANQYNLVSAGAKPHPIFSLTTKPMSFQTGYRAATQPRVLKSRRPQGFGRIKYAFAVMHPGFEGRKFHDEISKFYGPIFVDDMRLAMDRGAREQARILSFLESV